MSALAPRGRPITSPAAPCACSGLCGCCAHDGGGASRTPASACGTRTFAPAWMIPVETSAAISACAAAAASGARTWGMATNSAAPFARANAVTGCAGSEWALHAAASTGTCSSWGAPFAASPAAAYSALANAACTCALGAADSSRMRASWCAPLAASPSVAFSGSGG